jgi:hypothetical protein
MMGRSMADPRYSGPAMRSILLGIAGSAALAAVPLSALAQDPEVAEAVMRAQYGAQKDLKSGCWIHRTAGLGSYCMKIVQQHLVGAPDVPRLYLLAEGLPMDGNGAIQEVGAHAAPGLVGAFAVDLNRPAGRRGGTLVADIGGVARTAVRILWTRRRD